MKLFKSPSGFRMGVLYHAVAMVWLTGSVTPSSVSAGAPDWAWDLRPQEGRAYFLAFCPRMLDRDRELSECLKAASQQAAKYERVTVRAGWSSRRVLLFTVQDSWVDVVFDEALAGEIETHLDVVRELQSHEGTYLLAGLDPGTVKGSAPFAVQAPGPDWIERGYSLPGYYTAVGAAQKKRLFSNSAEEADRDALAGLALQLGSKVELWTFDSRRRAPGRHGYEETEAQIQGFLVIARARSEDGKYYYSLAVCPKDGNGE